VGHAVIYAFPGGVTTATKQRAEVKREVYCFHNKPVDFFTFDAQYLARLKAREPDTLNHFALYFTKCLTVKLRAAGRYSASGVEEIRQETLCRALKAVDNDAIRQPESLAGYMNVMCENVAHEWERDSKKFWSPDGDEFPDPPDPRPDAQEALYLSELRSTVSEVLSKLRDKDRKILTAVYIDERDKDEVCRQFNVSRDHLRLLLHRALKKAREQFGTKRAS
jgi:RNA polymerase sigma-70 factor (ECF subfamily)